MTGERIQGNIFDIKRYAIHDGNGIRVTVFMRGCPLDCWWCHNPEGIRPRQAGQPGQSGQTTPHTSKAGQRSISVNELIQEVEKDLIFIDESGGGVTFSGGEPLMQPDFLINALEAFGKRYVHRTLDTSGFADTEVFASVLEHVDQVLFDLKLINEEEHAKYTGVSNDLILKNLRILDQSEKDVILRLPVIPGITDVESNIRAIGELVSTLENIDTLELLSYHATARAKYERLGVEFRMGDIVPVSERDLVSIKYTMESMGIKVIGGPE